MNNKNKMYFEINKTKTNLFSWSLKSKNGETVAKGENYTTRGSVIRLIKKLSTFAANANNAKTVDLTLNKLMDKKKVIAKAKGLVKTAKKQIIK